MIGLVLALIVGTLGTSPNFVATEFGAADVVALVEHHGEHDPNAIVDLYGIHSGFAKARLGVLGERRSITVGPLPAELGTPENYALLDEAMDAWNTAAGWWLFMPDFDNPEADVAFHVDDERNLNLGGWVGWDQFPTGWYRRAHVFFHSSGPVLDSTWAHELGHALGLRDVQTTESGYFGIMSYARPADLLPNNPQDIASLRAAGYAE
jgi:hypothetical protein